MSQNQMPPVKPLLIEVPMDEQRCSHDYQKCGESNSQSEGKRVLLACRKCGDTVDTKPRKVIKESNGDKPLLLG